MNTIYNEINKLIDRLAQRINVRSDLIKHFSVSFILCFLLTILFPSVLSPISVMLIGITKEIYDKYKPNPTGFDITDLYADSLGTLMAYYIITLILIL